jgi:hypothetical protein
MVHIVGKRRAVVQPHAWPIRGQIGHHDVKAINCTGVFEESQVVRRLLAAKRLSAQGLTIRSLQRMESHKKCSIVSSNWLYSEVSG